MDLKEFRENAIKHGICGMLHDWDKANSKKQLMDIALSAPGMEYIAKSTMEDWGLDADYISREFEPFCNGKYVRECDGYNSALYCQSPDDIHIHTTAALIIDCHGTIYIDRSITELYIVNSNVNIEGRAFVYSYNSEVSGPQSIIREDYNNG